MPWIGPGRMIATSTTRSLKLLGRVRGSVCICARDSIWKTPMVSAALHISNTFGSSSASWSRSGRTPSRVLDQLQRLGDDRQRAQPEHVHLDQAEVLDVVLVELDDPPALHRRRLHRHDVDERLPGHQHAAVVDRQVTGKVDHLPAQLEELLPALRPHLRRWHRTRHRSSTSSVNHRSTPFASRSSSSFEKPSALPTCRIAIRGWKVTTLQTIPVRSHPYLS